jgi:hypothetical protein
MNEPGYEINQGSLGAPTLRVIRQFRGARLDFEKWFASNGITVRVIGQRESGKSLTLELLGLMALRRGCAVLDIAAARDSECMAPLLAFPEKVRLIVSDACIMTSKKVELHTIPISDFRLPEDGLWYVLPRAGFPSEAAYLRAMKRIIENLWASDEWVKPRWLLLREAQILLSSISRTTGSRAQRESSDALQQLNSEGRHHGLSIILDSQREIEVARSLRKISDVLIVKRLGDWIDFPEDLRYIFAEIEPAAFRFCPINKAYVFTSLGQIAFVDVDFVPFHHQRGRSILNILDIRVSFTEQSLGMESELRGRFDSRVAVLPEAHREIVRLRDVEKSSFDAIALKLGLAPSTAKLHYNRHRFALSNGLPCPNCSH